MRLAILSVLLFYILLAIAAVAFHWYAGTRDTATAHRLKGWYSFNDARNGKAYHAGETDLIIPSILFGLAAGAITAHRRTIELTWLIFFLPIGLVGLIPVYEKFLPDDWWLSFDYVDKFLVLGVFYVKSLVVGHFFVCIGRKPLPLFPKPNARCGVKRQLETVCLGRHCRPIWLRLVV